MGIANNVRPAVRPDLLWAPGRCADGTSTDLAGPIAFPAIGSPGRTSATRYARRVIVVIGLPFVRQTDDALAADGLAARVALSASAHGRPVQMVGKAGEDPEGDAVVLALARGGVGHVAFLRDAGMVTPRAQHLAADDADLPDRHGNVPATRLAAVASATDGTALDAADVELALRYLTSFSVLVLGQPADPDLLRVVRTAAGWADARLIVVLRAGEPVPGEMPPDAIVFEAPDEDPDGVFAEMVGAFAAALDDGDDPAVAFETSVLEAGWQPTSDA